MEILFEWRLFEEILLFQPLFIPPLFCEAKDTNLLAKNQNKAN